MKKIIAIFFIFFVFAICALNDSFFQFLAKLDKDAEVSFYCTEKQNAENCNVIQNGSGYIYSCSSLNCEDVYKNLSGCYGFSIKFFDTNIYETILKKIQIKKTEILNNLNIVYGFCNQVAFSNYVDNQKINVQVALSDDCVVVGCPIILGSY